MTCCSGVSFHIRVFLHLPFVQFYHIKVSTLWAEYEITQQIDKSSASIRHHKPAGKSKHGYLEVHRELSDAALEEASPMPL